LALVFAQNRFIAGFGQPLEGSGGRVRPKTLDVRITPSGSLEPAAVLTAGDAPPYNWLSTVKLNNSRNF
jgi:hypothetical protein